MNAMERCYTNVLNNLKEALKETVAIYHNKYKWLKQNGFHNELEYWEKKIKSLERDIAECKKDIAHARKYFGKKTA